MIWLSNNTWQRLWLMQNGYWCIMKTFFSHNNTQLSTQLISRIISKMNNLLKRWKVLKMYYNQCKTKQFGYIGQIGFAMNQWLSYCITENIRSIWIIILFQILMTFKKLQFLGIHKEIDDHTIEFRLSTFWWKWISWEQVNQPELWFIRIRKSKMKREFFDF